jgi:hypothetical protein
MFSVQFAVTLLALLLAAVSAWCALACLRALKQVSSRASTTSLRAELDEIRDAFEKNSALLKRINQRTVMQERRASAPGGGDDAEQQPGESAAAWKARMRARLIVPGRPVKHGQN